MLTLLLALALNAAFAQSTPPTAPAEEAVAPKPLPTNALELMTSEISALSMFSEAGFVLNNPLATATMNVCEADVAKGQDWASLTAASFRLRGGDGIVNPCSPEQAAAITAPVAAGTCAIVVLHPQAFSADHSADQDIDSRLVAMGYADIDQRYPRNSVSSVVAYCNRDAAGSAARPIELSATYYTNDAAAPATVPVFATRFNVDIAQTMTLEAFDLARRSMPDVNATPEQITAAVTTLNQVVADRESNTRIAELTFANVSPAFAALPYCIADAGTLPEFQVLAADHIAARSGAGVAHPCAAPASILAPIAPNKCAVFVAAGTVEGDFDLAVTPEGTTSPSADGLDTDESNNAVVFACNSSDTAPLAIQLHTRRYAGGARQALITRFDFDAGASDDGRLSGDALLARRRALNVLRVNRGVPTFVSALLDPEYAIGQFFSPDMLNIPFPDTLPICAAEFPHTGTDGYGPLVLSPRSGDGGHECSAARRVGSRTVNDITEMTSSVPRNRCVVFIAIAPFGVNIDLRIRFPGTAPRMADDARAFTINESTDASPSVLFCNQGTATQRIILEGRNVGEGSAPALILRTETPLSTFTSP
jgi:hypothetical protein